MSKQPTFSKGDKVRLGDGREGKVVGRKERSGFHGYIVEITSSIDENQVGQTVAATVQNMKKLSQMMPVPVPVASENPAQNPYVAPVVEEVSPTMDEEKENEMRKKELNYTRKQVQMLQQKINDLQTLIAQKSVNQPAGDQFEELDRIDQADEENVGEQKDRDLANQEMQQERILQDQQLRTQQQMTMNMQPMKSLSASRWVRPERANAKVAFGKTELYCDVAVTPQQQASGLQVYDSLPEDRGLWFPFTAKRSATFHMGDVGFPIDILFVDDSKIVKIVANVQPRQMGSWSALCTDVIEVNAGWCERAKVTVGSCLETPLTGKKRALSEVERDINRSWSAPQKARINSDKEGVATSYDTLRTITTAEGEELSDWEQRMLATFPFLKAGASEIQEQRAQEYYNQQTERLKHIDHPRHIAEMAAEILRYSFKWEGTAVEEPMLELLTELEEKSGGYADTFAPHVPQMLHHRESQEHRQPDTTDRRQPGEVDGRDPTSRFRHNTTPDVEYFTGDGDPGHVDPLSGVSNAPRIEDGNNADDFEGNYGKHWKRQIGYDPKWIGEDWPVAVRPTAQVTIKSPSPDTELAGMDTVKLANGSLTLYDNYSPEWNDYDTGEEYEGDPGYAKIAILNDETISKWIDSLGFDPQEEAKLRQTMFTDEYKVMLGGVLVTAGRIADYEIFDSDLLLYK